MLTHRAALALLLALAGACSSQIFTRASHDPDADFTGLKKYRWLPTKATGDPRIHDELLDKRVRFAVDRELAARGYTKVESGEDFLVGYFVAINNGRVREVHVDPMRYTTPHYGFGWPTWQTAEVYERDITEGTLALNVADREKHLMWRGYAWTEINPRQSEDSEKSQDRINRAVHMLVKQFPPPPGGGG